jgi:hypothetical protein
MAASRALAPIVWGSAETDGKQKAHASMGFLFNLERAMGIEPTAQGG